jgi:glycosyltransferase involved in cell wall biosynthesis
MKILSIAPLPPPLNGHSLASKVFYDHLNVKYHVELVNLSKSSLKEGIDSFIRIKEVLGFLKQVFKKRKAVDVIYFTISESLAGNIKDLIVYLFCYKKLSNMYIHLHGGSIKQCLWDNHKLLYLMNRFFIRRVGGVIVSGDSHLEIFDTFINRSKIHVIPDFAEDYLFLSEREIKNKFKSTEVLSVLFISNMIEKKGYNETLDAFLALDEGVRQRMRIDFAGRFESEHFEKEFLEKIKGIKEVHYHGIVDGIEKKNLFSQAHLLCFPTSFLEGQGIVILEAYASGCVVLTTYSGGVRDVFTDKVNGFLINDRSSQSVQRALEEAIAQKENLSDIALFNRQYASSHYRCDIYNQALEAIVASDSEWSLTKKRYTPQEV